MCKMKKAVSIGIIIAIFAAALALPGHAAGGTLAVSFETAEPRLPEVRLTRGAAFTADICAGAALSALRLYILYDSTVLAWNAGATVLHSLIAGGNYKEIREADGESSKYPAVLPAGKTAADYGVLVFQWCAEPGSGALPVLPAGETILTLGFSVKPGAPYPQPGGKLFVSTDYAYIDTPWFYAGDLDIDAAAAQLDIQPMPPTPVFATTLSGDGTYLWGFDPAIPVSGGANPWLDSKIDDYCTATEDGVFVLVPPAGCSLAGTGTALQLWNANETVLCGEWILLVFGDADGNFVVDYDDWAAMKAMLGPVDPANPFHRAADIDGDSDIDTADLDAVYHAARGDTPIPQI